MNFNWSEYNIFFLVPYYHWPLVNLNVGEVDISKLFGKKNIFKIFIVTIHIIIIHNVSMIKIDLLRIFQNVAIY